jgi:hypothetical protein
LAPIRKKTERLGSIRAAGPAFLLLLILAACAPTSALAADQVYWGGGPAVRQGNLDGTGTAQNLFTGEADPVGIGIDIAGGRIYWANQDTEQIRVGNLDGSGTAQTLFTEPNSLDGLAINPAANKIYWGLFDANQIRVGNLDGSGTAQTLFAGELGASSPTIDPAANKIYWTDYDAGTIRVGNLDGSGTATDLFTGESSPFGIAIDPGANKIYWTNQSGMVRVGNLDGSGTAHDLFAGESGASGIALDPGANKAYWANQDTGEIRVGNLDGSGSAQTLFTGELTPVFPALLRAPVATGAPVVSRVNPLSRKKPFKPGRLACNQTWAPDLLGAFLYQAPRTVTYQWFAGSTAISAATSRTFTPRGRGRFSCRATATNQAGSTTGPISALKCAKRPKPAGPGSNGRRHKKKCRLKGS